jgi:hypothetical protein
LNNLAYAKIGKLLMMCTGKVEPTDDEISHWLERLAAYDYDALLFSSRGAGPNSKQRARIAEFWRASGRKVPRTALLAESAAARFIMQAISWLLGVEAKSLPPDELRDALTYLGNPAPLPEVSGTLASLHAAVEFKQRRTA